MGESVSTESQQPKLCSWILFRSGLQVKKKSAAKWFGVTHSSGETCAIGQFRTDRASRQNRHFLQSSFLFKPNKSSHLCFAKGLFEMQRDHRLLLFAVPGEAHEVTQPTEQYPRNQRETGQYPNQNTDV